jgi:hypothetical protein
MRLCVIMTNITINWMGFDLTVYQKKIHFEWNKKTSFRSHEKDSEGRK